MTPAELDALIARLNALAEDLPDESDGWWQQLGPYWQNVIKEGVCPTLTKAAAAIAAQKEKLMQMGEIEGRADEVCKINDEMHAQIAALRADAERYRWLRTVLSECELDAAIDAARAEKPT